MNIDLKKLIENIQKPTQPLHIKIVCDSGAFNGLYMYGTMIYLKKLEELNYIKVNKLSGSSIGSFLAFCYLTDNLTALLKLYPKLRKKYRLNHNLSYWKKTIKKFFKSLPDNIHEVVNDKLYINYYNLETHSEQIKHNFNSKEELKNTILYSSFVPYFMNGKMSYKGNIDGFNPYIFKNRTIDDGKILFIHLNHLNKLKKSFHVKGEVNPDNRILEGILETHKLFTNTTSNLCSWINNWGVKEYFFLRIRQIIWLLIVYILYFIQKYQYLIPDSIYSNKIFIFGQTFLSKIYHDLFVVVYNS